MSTEKAISERLLLKNGERAEYEFGTSEMGIQADFSDEETSETDSNDDWLSSENASARVAPTVQADNPASRIKAQKRKAIELKYFFGDDIPKNELEKSKYSHHIHIVPGGPRLKVSKLKVSKADVVVPPGLQINKSTIPNSGHGVFAKCEIPKYDFFGPYVGEVIEPKDAKDHEDSPYIWEVKDDYGQINYYIDGRDVSRSNWLRYAKCGRTCEERNLRAVQYEKNIYYMATRDIHVGEELLTYFGENYAKKMGYELQNFTPNTESLECPNCKKIYSNATCLIGHLKYKCNSGVQRSIFVPQPTDSDSPVVKLDLPDDVIDRENEKLKKFRCTVCNKGFIRNYTLQCHMLSHTGKKDHKCETCGKAFTLAKHLQRHRLVHSGEKPYKCHLCGKSFSQQGSLQGHSRTHTGIKPYKCEVCGRAFSLQSPLLSHMKTHTKEKSHICTTCGKAFTHRNTLVRHELTHSGKRPYSCTKCGKMFTQTNDLKRHSRIHSGIRPYKCHLCDKSFGVEFTLVCHIRTHTGIRPYTCAYCDKTFTQPGARLKHIRSVHPGQPIPEQTISTKMETSKSLMPSAVNIEKVPAEDS